jgi:hypothetical protein
MNIYILYCKVVEIYVEQGVQVWWGAALARVRRSHVEHVSITIETVTFYVQD